MSSSTTIDPSMGSVDTLAIARVAASESREYNSQAAQVKISEELKKFSGDGGYLDWLVDMTEAITLGFDCLFTGMDVAGAGNTVMSFAAPLLVDQTKHKMVVIVSPPGQSQRCKAKKYRSMGWTVAVVSNEQYTKELHEEISNRKYQVILTELWMLLEHEQFSRLLRSPKFTKDVAAVAIEEAHCVSQWINSFRKTYNNLPRLRALVPTIPFVAASPTLPPMILSDVRQKLNFSTRATYFVNPGNDRANVTPMVVRMAGNAKFNDFTALDFTVREAFSGGDLVPTIIFFENCDATLRAWRYLKDLLPDKFKDRIDFLYSLRSDRAKEVVKQRFHKGEIKILCATEAGIVGVDVPTVRRVIQYMVPVSLFRWAQRYSHAGRDGKPAVAVLIAEASASKGARPCLLAEDTVDDTRGIGVNLFDDDSDDDASSDSDETERRPAQRQIEEGLLDWLETTECRRAVANKYFDNPVRRQDPVAPCCDLCLHKRAGEPDVQLNPDEQAVLQLLQHAQARKQVELPAEPIEDAGPSREAEHRNLVKEAILEWREDCWERNYGYCVWGPSCLIQDRIIGKLARSTGIETVEQIRVTVPDWAFVDDHGEDLLAVIARVDQEWKLAQG